MLNGSMINGSNSNKRIVLKNDYVGFIADDGTFVVAKRDVFINTLKEVYSSRNGAKLVDLVRLNKHSTTTTEVEHPLF